MTPSERSLFIRYRRSDDVQARRQLIERHLPLARRLARRYARSRDTEDLIQVASLALVKAVDRYDPARGTPFPSFAVPTILGELKRHFRDLGWALRIPRDVQERAQAVEREIERVTSHDRRPPSVRMLADALGLTVEEVVEAQAALLGRDTASLETPARDDGASERLRDRIGFEDQGYERVEDRCAVLPALATLTERDRLALRLRFVDDMTQSEIGEHLGISQMQVSRLLRRALDQLRKETTNAPPASPAPV